MEAKPTIPQNLNSLYTLDDEKNALNNAENSMESLGALSSHVCKHD